MVPKAEKPTLKDISFSIKRGEKISIVGLNGAGKSTLVKLICRMYKLDSGEILVNGKNIYDYDYRTYMNSISAVFQDYKLFNFTIAEMVILDEPASALDPIAEAEIYEKFNSLVEDKTAIYISHRMSSSKFCDKILIIDGGTVADYDTHDNLMKKTESLYYKLFMAQAENYKLA